MTDRCGIPIVPSLTTTRGAGNVLVMNRITVSTNQVVNTTDMISMLAGHPAGSRLGNVLAYRAGTLSLDRAGRGWRIVAADPTGRLIDAAPVYPPAHGTDIDTVARMVALVD